MTKSTNIICMCDQTFHSFIIKNFLIATLFNFCFLVKYRNKKSTPRAQTSAKLDRPQILCSIYCNVNEKFKVIQNAGFLPDHHQNLISSSSCHFQESLKISCQSTHNFLSYVANRKTNKQRDSKHNLLLRR